MDREDMEGLISLGNQAKRADPCPDWQKLTPVSAQLGSEQGATCEYTCWKTAEGNVLPKTQLQMPLRAGVLPVPSAGGG